MARPDTWYRLGTGQRLDCLRRLLSYGANEFDCVAGAKAQRGQHYSPVRASPLYHSVRPIKFRVCRSFSTHAGPAFLDYMDILPLLEHFDVVVPSLPGYGFSSRPPKVLANRTTIGTCSDAGNSSCLALGIPRYGCERFYDLVGQGVTTSYSDVEHPKSMIGILSTTWSRSRPQLGVLTIGAFRCRERSYRRGTGGQDLTVMAGGYNKRGSQSQPSPRLSAMDLKSTPPGRLPRGNTG